MFLKHYQPKNLNCIVEHLFHLTFFENEMPFESTVIPNGCMSITYIYGKNQSGFHKQKDIPLKDLIITGQFYDSYKFSVKSQGFSYGISFHPTAIHKLTGLDVSIITEKHLPLADFSKKLFHLLNPIFIQYQNNVTELTTSIESALLSLAVNENDTINQIDTVIEYIHSKDGMLSTYEVLDYVNFSQKTLETQFKKIVGLTPGKYIRLYRFLKLMKKYETKEIALVDLIYMYNYYDQSHFTKDFKHFMKQSPKTYFKNEHPFINEYLNQ